jgi:excisionase family DNA binding protein
VKHAEEPIQERAFLSIQWFSIYLGISPKSAYAMVEQDKVPHYRIGRLIRFKRSEIDLWMEGNKKGGGPPEQVAMRVLRPGKRTKLDVDRIVRKAIDGTRGQGYTTSHGKTRPQGPQEGGQ